MALRELLPLAVPSDMAQHECEHLLIQQLTLAMTDIMQRLTLADTPGAFLARHLAGYTQQQVCLLPENRLATSTVPPFHDEISIMNVVSYAGIRYGTLHIRASPVPDLCSRALAKALADTCGWLLYLHYQSSYIQRQVTFIPQELSLLFERLSSREREIVRWLALGYPPKAIAEQLGLAVKTVRTHERHIFAKLNVDDVRQVRLVGVLMGVAS
jgi:DNA-binding CsgD family transcriptional regulator